MAAKSGAGTEFGGVGITSNLLSGGGPDRLPL